MLWVRCSFIHLKYSLRKEKADSGYPLPANGGDGGIRTPGRFDPSTDFESASLRPLRYISMLYFQRFAGFPLVVDQA